MKVRSDFVTNSSSSSFTLVIDIELKDGTGLNYEAWGVDDMASLYYDPEEAVDFDKMSEDEISKYDGSETDFCDYTDESYPILEVTVSPKQLGQVESIQDLIDALKDHVKGDWDSEMSVFRNPKDVNAANFIYDLAQLKSVDEIKSISITGEETNYRCYNRTYSYDLETGEYTGSEEGCEFEKDGSSGGDLYFSDKNEATVVYEDLED